MKRRFEFRLERVARIRDIEERVARAERASAETLARAAEERRDQARAVLERSRAWLRDILRGRIDARAVLASHRALDSELERLRHRVESARTLRIQAERMAAVHRAQRSAARALEELRIRARARHRSQLEKEENAVLDEAAQQLADGERASRPTRPRSDQGPGSLSDSPA